MYLVDDARFTYQESNALSQSSDLLCRDTYSPGAAESEKYGLLRAIADELLGGQGLTLARSC